jgi:ribosomal protein S18 acetylase RimI-like enzyme
MTAVLVRPAGAADAEDLARVRIASWRAAYRGIVPDAVLDGFDPVAEVVTWRRRLASVTDVWTGVAFVAEPPARPRLVGFVTTGAARHAGEAGLGEVWAIYVDPDAQGQGVGRALMEAGIRDRTMRGFGEAVLWVFEANAPARAFYARLGWTPDGAAKPLAIGGAAPIELRYRRRLP